MATNQIEKIEVDIICEAIYRRYGIDFRHYSSESLKRRFIHFLQDSSFTNLSELITPILHDETFFSLFLPRLLVSVTEMFRDPSFFLEFKKTVIPILKTYPFIKIWHAGCATGEEVYSLAILLEEAGLLSKTILYGTDINLPCLRKAQEGIFSVGEMEGASERYLKAGGIGSLSDYYTHKYEFIKIHDHLKENIVFSSHNLASDSMFGQMHVILCRNVFIYFDKILQNKIVLLFSNSLTSQGFLCLGSKESLEFLIEGDQFETISSKEKIFQKKF